MMVRITRRALLATAPTVSLVGAARPAMAADRARIVALRTDLLEKPLGLETPRPLLSWRMETDRVGARQAAYRVRVASRPELLTAGGTLWDSGRIETDRSLAVAYAGPALASRQRCYWTVEVWDETGARLVADKPGAWEMGLLAPSDWRAGWLAAEEHDLAGDRAAGLNWIWSTEPTTEAPQGFRHAFTLAEQPASAELMVVARDSFDGVWLNGVAVPYRPFKPGVVNSARMLRIPIILRQGRNVLAIGATYKPKLGPPSGAGAMAAVLRVTHADGRVERVLTGPAWRAGPATGAWTTTDFADRRWRPAVAATRRPTFDPWAAGPAMLLRRRFIIGRPIASARLYVTALGGYAVSINGRPVTDGVLAPESTDFRKRALYRVHDVTELLRRGDNVLGALVGDGWYGSTGLFAGRYSFGPAPCRLLVQLEIVDTAGDRQVVATGPGWTTAPSPVLASEIYDGEIYDARREMPGWDTPGFDDATWRPAVAVPVPPARLVAELSPPIRVQQTLKPVSVREVRPGVHVFDFGQNMSGWPRLRGRAPAGTTVKMRFAEVLKPSGEIDQANLRSAEARDIYIFRGTGEERYRPHFTYHGFRYVELTGWTGRLPNDLLAVEVLTSDLDETGTFRTEDALLGKIWRNTLWGQRSNFLGIPTDCPQRDERLGWMGDAQVFWDAASFNMDTDAFTRRFMGDARDSQDANGAFAEYNPQSGDSLMRGAPGWADAGIILPWTAWWRYGDTRIIDENWTAMQAYAAHVLRENPDGLWRRARGTDYGDWLALDAKEPGDPTTPKDLVATAYWAHVTGKMAEMAAATGRTAEAARYRNLRERIGRAYRAAFVRADGSIGNGSQTGYIVSLRFGLLPAAQRRAAADRLVADIRRRSGALSSGFLGTPHALDVLADSGHAEMVRALLARTEYPSWGYMIAKGATTMWERWNSDVGDVAMNSFNHYAFGAVVGFFYRRLAGIDALAPGFRTIGIRPAFDVGLASCGATYDSVMGRIETAWTRRDDGIALRATVPPNTTARIHLPTGRSDAIREGGRPISGRATVRTVSAAANETVLEVGAGRYTFETMR